MSTTQAATVVYRYSSDRYIASIGGLVLLTSADRAECDAIASDAEYYGFERCACGIGAIVAFGGTGAICRDCAHQAALLD